MADTAVQQPTAAQIAEREKQKSALTMLEKMKPAIAAVLPKHLTPERMAMIAFTAMRKTPKLLECSPESVAGSIMTAAMLGLEPSGPLGHGALIPYWAKHMNNGKGGFECQFQPMYQGLLDLARRSGFVKDVQLRAVYEGDHYLYRFGLDPTIEHIPLDGPGADDPDRVATNVYAIIRLTSGGVQWDQMSFAQGLAHGKRYSPSWDYKLNNGKGGFKYGSVWADNPLAMILKTILKIVLKLCPKSPELSAALQMDDLADAGKTSTMKSLGEGVFDVDFEDTSDARSRGTLDMDAIRKGEDNRGHGNENLEDAGKKPETTSTGAETEGPKGETKPQTLADKRSEVGTGTGAPADTKQPTRSKPTVVPNKAPERERPIGIVVCQEDWEFLYDECKIYKLTSKAMKDHIIEKMGYNQASRLRNDDFETVVAWIQSGGKEVPRVN